MTEFDQKNPYDVLGIPHGCSVELITATYKSLVKVFHPDVFQGDRDFAAQRMAEINIAYEYLSDEQSKAKYDEFLSRSKKDEYDEDYDPKNENNEFTRASDILKENWLFACEYHPELKLIHERLSKIDSNSGVLFIMIMVEEQLFLDAESIASELENQFLKSKFGTDKEVIQLAKFCILNKKFKFAQQLNRALKVLGENSKEQIFAKLAKDHPQTAREAFPNIGRSDVVKNVNINEPSATKTRQWEMQFDRAVQSGKISLMIKQLEWFGYDVTEAIIDKSGSVKPPESIRKYETYEWAYRSNFELMTIMSKEKKRIRKYIFKQ